MSTLTEHTRPLRHSRLNFITATNGLEHPPSTPHTTYRSPVTQTSKRRHRARNEHGVLTGQLRASSPAGSRIEARRGLWGSILLRFSDDFIDPLESSGKTIFYCVLLTSFLGAFDNTVLSAISSKMAADLGALGVLPWIISSYSIAQSAASPLTVVISNKTGRRPILIWSIALFLIGTLLCCFDMAPQIDKPVYKWAPVVVGRLISGFGAAGMSALPNIIINDKAKSPGVNAARRMQATNFIYNVAAALGSPIGGVIAQHAGWRNVFRGQLGICFLSLIVAFWGVKETRQNEDKSSREYDKWNTLFPDSKWEIDWLGGGLLFTSTAALLVALTLGSDILSWNNFVTWIMFSIAGSSFFILLLWEWRLGKNMVKRRKQIIPSGIGARVSLPIIELSDFTRQTTTARFGGFFASFAHGVMTFWVPIYLEATGLSVGTTGYILIAPSVATTCVYALAMKFDGFCKKWLNEMITAASFLQCLSILGLLLSVFFEASWKIIISIFTINMAVATYPIAGLNVFVLKPLHWLAEKQKLSNAAEQKFTAIGQSTTHVIGGLGFSLSVPLASLAYQSTNKYVWVFVLSVCAAASGLGLFIIMILAPNPWPKGWEPSSEDVKKLPVLSHIVVLESRTTSLDEGMTARRRQTLTFWPDDVERPAFMNRPASESRSSPSQSPRLVGSSAPPSIR